MTKLKKLMLSIIALNSLLVVTAEAGIVVIGHSSTTDSLSGSQLKRLYLSKDKSLPSGAAVELIDFAEGSPSRDQFYSKFVKKSPQQIKAYHAKLIFSGNGSPPDQLDSAAKIKAWVAKKPGRLGYIDSADVDGSVKVISIN